MAMDLLLSFFGLKSSYLDKYHPLFSLPANIFCFSCLMMMMVFGQGEVLTNFQKAKLITINHHQPHHKHHHYDDHDDDNDHHATMITSAGMRLPFLELGAERGKHGEVEPRRI